MGRAPVICASPKNNLTNTISATNLRYICPLNLSLFQKICLPPKNLWLAVCLIHWFMMVSIYQLCWLPEVDLCSVFKQYKIRLHWINVAVRSVGNICVESCRACQMLQCSMKGSGVLKLLGIYVMVLYCDQHLFFDCRRVFRHSSARNREADQIVIWTELSN